MALELVAGAILGVGAAELWRATMDAKKSATNFRPLLTQLESTVGSIVPHVNEISQLNHKLNLPQEETNELITLLQHRQSLVHKCSKISSVNLVKKGYYSKQLVKLDYSLIRYFQTILPLDHLRDNKEILLMVRELHMKIVGDDKDQGNCNQSESERTEEGEEDENENENDDDEEHGDWIIL